MADGAFTPTGSTVNLAVTTVTGAVALTDLGLSQAVRVHNSGAVTVFINFGASTVTATTAAGMPIPAGAVETFDIGRAGYAAGITASGSATVYFTSGLGI